MHNIIAITKKEIGEDFIELGHTVPADISQDMQLSIKQSVLSFLDIIDLYEGPSHTEVITNKHGVYIVEGHPRTGGDRIVSLVRLTTGIDLIARYLHYVCNENYKPLPIKAKVAKVKFINFDNNNVYKGASSLEKIPDNIEEIEVSVNIGDIINQLRENIKKIIIIENYDHTSAIEQYVFKISQVNKIDVVFATAEFDLYRAERIKKWLGLDFIPEENLKLFRNKIAMKKHFQLNNIQTSKYTSVKSVLDIYDFGKKYGYPLVLKQQEGGGGVGTKVLSSQEDVAKISLQNFRQNGYTEPSLMIESYVKGKLYHVDGAVFNGKVVFISCGEYINGLIHEFKAGGSLASLLIPEKNEIHQKLSNYNKKVIATSQLKVPYTFHAEYFIDGDRITLCEIACRTGGVSINQTNKLIRGVDLNVWLLNTIFLQTPMKIIKKIWNIAVVGLSIQLDTRRK